MKIMYVGGGEKISFFIVCVLMDLQPWRGRELALLCGHIGVHLYKGGGYADK